MATTPHQKRPKYCSTHSPHHARRCVHNTLRIEQKRPPANTELRVELSWSKQIDDGVHPPVIHVCSSRVPPKEIQVTVCLCSGFRFEVGRVTTCNGCVHPIITTE